MKKSKADRIAAAAARLRELYAIRGSVRVPDEFRRRNETWQTYKHGYELRFNARDRSELRKIQGLLRTVGIDHGRSCRTSGGQELPIYGAERVLRTIIVLGLTPKSPRRRTSSDGPTAPPRPVHLPPARGDAASAIADRRQWKIVMRLADRGPLTARKLSATGSQLAHLRRHGIVAALPKEGSLPRVWALTPKGIRETRRCRKV